MTLKNIIAVSLSLCSVISATQVCIHTEDILFKVDPTYVSFCVDAYLLGTQPRWMNFNFKSPRLHFMLKQLAPAILRLGGSPADWTRFSTLDEQRILNATGIQPSMTIFTQNDLDRMINLTRSTGNRFLFDLNNQLRYGKQWDPSNAIEMFNYIAQKNYGADMDFELGNEPAAYSHPGQVKADPHQVAADFLSLWDLMRQYPGLHDSSLVGPDEVDVGGPLGGSIVKQVTEKCGGFMRAITIHQYYFEGDKAVPEDYLDPKYFAALRGTILAGKALIQQTSHPDTPLWLGETADSWHSGTQNVTDRFISGFLWLEKLGLAATLGVSMVMRQTFYGHFYGLIDDQLDPNPDYWVSWVHKTLVGQSVLNVTTSGGLPTTTRVYAHCTNTQRTNYPSGSVTLFGLNVNQTEADVLHLDPSWTNQIADVYHMTPPPDDPDRLLSKFVAVNGQTLRIQGDKMPVLQPNTVKVSSGIKLPPLSLLFVVFPHAKAQACS